MVDIHDYDYDDEYHYPQWLKAVAIRADELVKQPPIMERFRQIVRQWKTEHDTRQLTKSHDSKELFQYNTVELMPVRATTIAEEYAALAALHDVLCPDAVPINPWHIDGEVITDNTYTMVMERYPYEALCSRVEELNYHDQEQDEHRRRIEGWLKLVEKDITQNLPSAEKNRNNRGDNFEGYTSADSIRIDHGILASRLSEGKTAGRIRSIKAPAGIKDSQGKSVRIFYHVGDAIKYADPQHTRR